MILRGLQVGDYVKIDHPGWYGHGEIGKVDYFGQASTGAYVRLPDGKCYRHEQKFLTKVNEDERRAILRETLLHI
jgi:hypothetical protein